MEFCPINSGIVYMECTQVYWVYMGMHEYTWVYISVHWYTWVIWVYMTVHECICVYMECTWEYMSAHQCTWVYVSACTSCHGCIYMMGIHGWRRNHSPYAAIVTTPSLALPDHPHAGAYNLWLIKHVQAKASSNFPECTFDCTRAGLATLAIPPIVIIQLLSQS